MNTVVVDLAPRVRKNDASPVPPGLYDLMGDIAKEVMHDQPAVLFEYVANYLETLLLIRKSFKNVNVSLKNLILQIKEIMVYLRSLDVTWEQGNIAASIIQRAYRDYMFNQEATKHILGKQSEVMVKQKLAIPGGFQECVKEVGIDLDIEEGYNAHLAKKSIFKGAGERPSTRMINRVTGGKLITPLFPSLFKKDIRKQLSHRHQWACHTREWDKIVKFLKLEKQLALKAQFHHPYRLVYEESADSLLQTTWSNFEEGMERKLLLNKKSEYKTVRGSEDSEEKRNIRGIAPSGTILKDLEDQTPLCSEYGVEMQKSYYEVPHTPSNVSLNVEDFYVIRPKEYNDRFNRKSVQIDEAFICRSPLDETPLQYAPRLSQEPHKALAKQRWQMAVKKLGFTKAVSDSTRITQRSDEDSSAIPSDSKHSLPQEKWRKGVRTLSIAKGVVAAIPQSKIVRQSLQLTRNATQVMQHETQRKLQKGATQLKFVQPLGDVGRDDKADVKSIGKIVNLTSSQLSMNQAKRRWKKSVTKLNVAKLFVDIPLDDRQNKKQLKHNSSVSSKLLHSEAKGRWKKSTSELSAVKASKSPKKKSGPDDGEHNSLRKSTFISPHTSQSDAKLNGVKGLKN